MYEADKDYFSRAIIAEKSNLSKNILEELKKDKNFYIMKILVKSRHCTKYYFSVVVEQILALDYNNSKKWPEKAGEDIFLMEVLENLIEALLNHKYGLKENDTESYSIKDINNKNKKKLE